MRNYHVKRNVLSILLGKKSYRIPVTSLAGCGGIETVEIQKASGYHCPKAHKDPISMANLAIAAQEYTGIENVRVPFDFVVGAEALGCQIRWDEKPESLPSVLKTPHENPEDLIMPENLLERGRIPVVLESIRLIREKVGDYLPISSLSVGPISLAGELMGITNLLLGYRKKPDHVKQFIDFATEFCIKYARAQYQAGSDIVQVADPTASLSLSSPNIFREFAMPALSKVADSLGGIRILHVCGRTKEILPDLAMTGFDGLSLEGNVAQIRSLVGDVRILGNISSANTLVKGSVEDVKKEALKAIEEGVDLLESDCGFSPMTPLRNIKAMVEVSHKHNRAARARKIFNKREIGHN